MIKINEKTPVIESTSDAYDYKHYQMKGADYGNTG